MPYAPTQIRTPPFFEEDDPLADILTPRQGTDELDPYANLADPNEQQAQYQAPPSAPLAPPPVPPPALDQSAATAKFPQMDDAQDQSRATLQFPQTTDTRNAQQRLDETLARAKDVYTPKKPGIWNILGAAGLGAAEGWQNSNPKGRPVDYSGGIQNILYPGQKQREKTYGAELSAAQEAAKSERENEYKQAQITELGARTGLANAQAAKAEQEKEPHAGMQQLEPSYAKDNLPWLLPNEKGEYWVDKTLANTLTKPEKAAPLHVVPAGSTVVDDHGKVLFSAPEKSSLGGLERFYVENWAAERGKKLDELSAPENLAAMADFKKANTSPESVPASMKLAMQSIGIDPETPLGKLTPKQAGQIEQKIKPPAPTIALTDSSVDQNALRYLQSGELPAFGQGAAAAAARQRILNRAAELQGDGAGIAANKADYRANSGSLTALQKNRDAVVSFENTAGKNLDLFLKLAQPIIDSGSPWVNQPLRSISKSGLGSADQAAYDTARQVALNEIAKVTSNPGLSGQLSDSARHEVSGLLPESATLAQIYRVANVLKQDMENRRVSYDQQLGEIRGRLTGQKGGEPSPATPATNPNPNGYIVGHRYGDLTYLGGDPNNRASWK